MCIRDRVSTQSTWGIIKSNINMIPSLEKRESTTVTSTTQYESAVLQAPLSRIWPVVKQLDLKALLPTFVENFQILSGGAGQLDTTVQVTFKDQAVWTYKIVEISELSHTISFELISCEPAITASSVVNTITLRRVTETNQTLLEWETNFSNDADAAVILDNKYKKLEFFKDLHRTIEALRSK
eukprot:TRINITY_DN2124_c0_g1_i1.p1 TRINITY_DN2124_c0_g1~~TRINITY_DN2124_c0_g1_i1.p1  ORF type:complete len:203 (+),score=76.23 TRINITY_DN2124_c0_g1_i1:63-611(+)